MAIRISLLPAEFMLLRYKKVHNFRGLVAIKMNCAEHYQVQGL